MRVFILGCGRIGAMVADLLSSEGHDVTVIDSDQHAVNRLTARFNGTFIHGVGIDEEFLENAGLTGADAFIALTEGDNTNVMAAQVAKHIFNIPNVISQIKDPIRGESYVGLGIQTICPTIIGADAIRDAINAKS